MCPLNPQHSRCLNHGATICLRQTVHVTRVVLFHLKIGGWARSHQGVCDNDNKDDSDDYGMDDVYIDDDDDADAAAADDDDDDDEDDAAAAAAAAADDDDDDDDDADDDDNNDDSDDYGIDDDYID
ncbi:hypothetical protein RRG08_005327, partial [Elysia crispata]